jgi:hypothetical protein
MYRGAFSGFKIKSNTFAGSFLQSTAVEAGTERQAKRYLQANVAMLGTLKSCNLPGFKMII